MNKEIEASNTAPLRPEPVVHPSEANTDTPEQLKAKKDYQSGKKGANVTSTQES